MKAKKFFRIFLLCILGLLFNLGGSQIMDLLGIPLYLDTIGTILTAVLGGYLPGVLVALCSHLVTALYDPGMIYYTSLSVIIAVLAAAFSHRGYFKSVVGTVVFTVLTAVTAGGLGSVLTWFIYGFSEEKVLVPFVKNMYRNGTVGPFTAQLFSDLLIDIADKIVNMVIIVPVISLLPKSFKKKLRMEGWMQNPLTEREKNAIIRSNTRKHSIRTRILVLVTVALFVVAVSVTAISFRLYRKSVVEEHTRYAVDVAKLAASVVDPEMVDTYIEQGSGAKGYLQTKQMLEKIRSGSTDIRFIYVYKVMRDGCHVVFDLDVEGLPGDEPGVVVVLDRSFADETERFLNGEEIDPKITDDSYGWLLTAYEPIRNSEGDTVAYAAVDVLVDRLRNECIAFLTKQITLFLALFIVLLVTVLWLAEYNIVLPVNAMSMATSAFAYNLEENAETSVDRIRELNIRTGDEIETLYHVLEKMTEDSVKYVEEIRKKTEG